MDLFCMPRYRYNILLLKILGQWPYQPKIQSFILSFITMFIFSSLLIPQIHRCIIEPTEEVLIPNITPVLTVTVSIVKTLNCILNANKFRRLLTLMQDEWAKLKPGSDYNIMTEYANDAYKYSLYYCLLVYNSMVVFLLLPMRPKIMVWLGLAKGEAEFQLPYPTDYWIDTDKYFFFIESHICIGTTFVITAVLAPDVFFMVFVQHACGIFAVIRNRLENIPIDTLDKSYPNEEKNSFWIIRDCIKLHNRIIEFSELLDDTYCWSFMYVVLINTLLLTFSGIQIVAHMNDIEELFQYGPFAVGQLMHIFVETIIAQQLMDHSKQIDYAIIMMKWHSMSLKSQKLLNLMTIRSRVTCQITAGKFFILSLEFFTIIVKTSMSYFTLLSSMRED